MPGRDFELRLRLDPTKAALRIEVSDARGERLPDGPTETDTPIETDGEGGRGLLLVAALSLAWGVTERAVGKTVWAELPCPEAEVYMCTNA